MAPSSLTRPFQLNSSRLLLGLGALLVAACVAIALLAPAFVSWGWLLDPQDSLSFPLHAPPSAEHWFGTSRQGYDVFSRTLFGTRVALQIVVLATGISLSLGVPLGLASGYFGGKLDRLLVFLMDTVYALPGLLLSATLAFVVGRGVVNAAIAVSIAYVPQYFRVVRNHTASVKSELFVEAAQALGASPWRVLTRYVFGNVVQSVPVLFALNAADAVLVLGGLGFLGLGVPESVPEWGYSLRQALDALPTGIWWTALFPGLAMTLLVVGMSLFGEGLSEFFSNPDRD
ncbi:MAG: ABC transporter permease [Cyanobacteria bacterium J06641_5]